MDRNEKLAAARKKLKKFQARNSPQTQNKTSSKTLEPAANGVLTPSSVSPPMSGSSTPSYSKKTKLSSTEELRGISREISSLLSENSFSGRKNEPLAPPLPTLVSPHLSTTDTTSAPWTVSNSHSAIHLDAKPSLSTPPFSLSQTLPSLSISLPAPQLVEPIQTPSSNQLLYPHHCPPPVATTATSSLPNGDPYTIHVATTKSYPAPLFESSSLSTKPVEGLHNMDATVPSLNGRGPTLFSSSSGEELGKMETHLSPSIDQHTQLLQAVHKKEVSDGRGVVLSVPTHNHFHSHMAEGDLKNKVQAHAQTIDILVSEKSALQLELSSMQSQLSNKTRECSDVQSHLKATRQKLEEIQRDKLLLSDELARKEKSHTDSHSEVNKLREIVDRLRASLEDVQQENTELISKITSQSAEITTLQSSNTDLQSKLNMAELLAQQLSGDTSHDAASKSGEAALAEQLSEVKGQVEHLRSSLQRVTSDRDQANSDLSALRDVMLQQQDDNARKLAECQSQLAERSVQVTSLTQELADLQREKETLVQKLSSEHAQFEHSNNVAMTTVQEERDNLRRELQQQIQDNTQLTRRSSEHENRVVELEMELSRLKEQTVDHQSLLTTIAQDKETLSRAMSQNKELKSNIAELQDAFVHLSHQNMELASELETKRHHLVQMEKSFTSLPLTTPLEIEHAQATPTPQQTTPTPPETTPLPVSESGEGTTDLLPQEGEEEVNRSVSEMEETESDRDGLAKEHQELEGLLAEKTSLLDQLHELQSAHTQLVDEHHGLMEQFSQVKHELELSVVAREKEETDFIGEEVLMDVDNMSQEQLSTLQNNFNALQQRFVSLMAEKAELLDQFQEQEHTITQLASETETIGEYIALYQMQREALKKKSQEKEGFIRQLLVDKEAVQTKLHELQQLVKQLMLEKAQAHLPKLGPHKHHHETAAHPHTPHTPSPPSHPPSPTDIPIHLRPYSHDKPSSPSPPAPMTTVSEHMNIHEEEEGDVVLQEEEGSHVTTATAEQIMQLLDQLETDSNSGVALVVPCQWCTGELIST